MSLVRIHPPAEGRDAVPSPLPQLIQTPSGLALLELQGIINLPQDSQGEILANVDIGSLHFPDYVPGAEGSAWMKRAHLFVGQHQRLTGEVKKLPKAMAIVRKRENRILQNSAGSYTEPGENLEVVEIVKYKLIFANRPEPVGTAQAVAAS